MKNNNILPQNLHDILIGIMLGDGHIYKSSPTSNSRFEISFGKDRENFAIWISDLFEDYSNSGINTIYYDKSFFNTSFGYRFKTKSLSIFNSYHDLFYKKDNITWKYHKIVPSNIKSLMNPIVLAYLIMGDGNYDKGRNRVRIYTNSFLKQDVEKLSLSINNNLGIYTGVLYDRNDQWILTIGAKNLELLRNTVRGYFHSTMLYRIGL